MNLSFLKPALLSLILLFQFDPHPAAAPSHLRYQRAVTLSPLAASRSTPAPTQACAVLDASVFAHSAPSLKDLRLYSGRTEVPYAITISEPAQQEAEDARIFNLALRSNRVVFDLEMPHRPYSAVVLDLAAQDFFATATVTGSSTPSVKPSSPLGTFTLFDLTSQHLSRNTTLALAESTLPYLHVELAFTPTPGAHPATPLNRPAILHAVTVPPSREAQSVYTTLQQTSTITQRGHQSVATFAVPVRTPIESIAVVLDPSFKGNFSRNVAIDADAKSTISEDPADASEPPPAQPGHETAAGSILRVHLHPAGREASPDISVDRLTVPVAIGSNMQHPAALEVAIDNGAQPPLPIAAIQLQMRRRLLCFDPASAPGPLTLVYGGDNTLDAPAYEYDRLFQAAANPRPAELAPEALDPSFVAPPSTRAINERHSQLLWLGLLAIVCLFAMIALYAAKKHPHH